MSILRCIMSYFYLNCIIRGCRRPARYAAGVANCGHSDGFGSMEMGRTVPICGRDACVEKVKKVEQVSEVRLTPIERSLFSKRTAN